MQQLGKQILKVLFYLFILIAAEFRKLGFIGRGKMNEAGEFPDQIWTEDKITDILEVFKPTRVFFVFNILAFIIFILLPQGQDVIFIVIEDLSKFRPWSLISLLFGITGWSVLAE